MKRKNEDDPLFMPCKKRKAFIQNLYPQFTKKLCKAEYDKLNDLYQRKYIEFENFVIYAKC